MNRKFNNDEERKEARRISNNAAQKRSRAKAKANKLAIANSKSNTKKDLVSVIPYTLNFASKYVNDLRTKWAEYPFNHSLTVTNKTLVTGNMQEKAVMDLLNGLVAKGYITNYLKMHERCGGNYHSHILFQSSIPLDVLEEYIRYEWGSGFFRLKYMFTDEHRVNAVKYCFKQLELNPNSDATQFLIDTWGTNLAETFEDLKRAKTALIQKYKEDNGLNMKIDWSKYNFKSFVTDSNAKP